MKRVTALVAVVLIGIGVWWFSRPKPNDRQQILNALQAIPRSAQTKNARGITSLLMDNFSWHSLKRREINSQLTGFFFGYDAVDVQFPIVNIKVMGEKAQSRGSYAVKFRSAPDQPFETRRGDFSLDWRKVDGVWKIESASGGENLAAP